MSGALRRLARQVGEYLGLFEEEDGTMAGTPYGVDVGNSQHPGGASINYAAAYADLKARGDGARPFWLQNLHPADHYRDTDLAGARAAGFATGGYVWLDPSNPDIAGQVRIQVASLHPHEPCATDLEINPTGAGWAQIAADLGAAAGAIAAAGFQPIIYDNISWFESMPGEPVADYPHWLADPSHPTAPVLACLIQQYSATGTVAGIPAQVDLNIWRGGGPKAMTYEAFFGLAPSPPPTPPPAPPPPAQEDVMLLVQDPVSHGTWLIWGCFRVPVPNPAVMKEYEAAGAKHVGTWTADAIKPFPIAKPDTD